MKKINYNYIWSLVNCVLSLLVVSWGVINIHENINLNKEKLDLVKQQQKYESNEVTINLAQEQLKKEQNEENSIADVIVQEIKELETERKNLNNEEDEFEKEKFDFEISKLKKENSDITTLVHANIPSSSNSESYSVPVVNTGYIVPCQDIKVNPSIPLHKIKKHKKSATRVKTSVVTSPFYGNDSNIQRTDWYQQDVQNGTALTFH